MALYRAQGAVDPADLVLDRAEILRYLGHRGSAIPPEIDALIDRSVQAVRAAATPRYVCREFLLGAPQPQGIPLLDTDFYLPGEDILQLLAGCDSCVLMAATLGAGVDALLRRQQVADMAAAVNRVVELNGGIVVWDDGRPAAEVPLAIAGIMSDEPLAVVNEKLERAKAVAHSLGVGPGIDPFMTLSFMALPVIPSLRITTRGVFDVTTQSYV